MREEKYDHRKFSGDNLHTHTSPLPELSHVPPNNWTSLPLTRLPLIFRIWPWLSPFEGKLQFIEGPHSIDSILHLLYCCIRNQTIFIVTKTNANQLNCRWETRGCQDEVTMMSSHMWNLERQGSCSRSPPYPSSLSYLSSCICIDHIISISSIRYRAWPPGSLETYSYILK